MIVKDTVGMAYIYLYSLYPVYNIYIYTSYRVPESQSYIQYSTVSYINIK